MALKKIISGGQTGADQGGLAAGKALGLETGGWLPRGCMTETGRRPDLLTEYGMFEHCSTGYAPRTEINVLHSDGTALFGDMSSPGSRLTIKLCKEHGRPYIINPKALELREWLDREDIKILNVAGNRASKNPAVMLTTFNTLMIAFEVEK